MLPTWFICDAARIRGESKLQAHQWRAQATDATFEAEIASLFDIQAKRVLAEARISAASTGVPSNDLALALAYPKESIEQWAERIEEQKALAIQAAEQLTIAKLWYSLPSDGMDERAKGYYINGMTLQGSLKKTLQVIRRRVGLSTALI